MTPHPNAMVAWTHDIACQRGCERHHDLQVHIDLGVPSEPHGYFDYPQVPRRLALEFDMLIWDPSEHPVDGGPYCPAHDAVSETILSHRIWEPRETILARQVLSTAPAGGAMFDMGAQLGWYSLLALGSGVPAFAFEADPLNLAMLRASAALNGWEGNLVGIPGRIGATTGVLSAMAPTIRFAKLDLEGAEEHAVRMLWPWIEDGRLDHMLMEVSPCFGPGYPELVQRIIDVGYAAYTLPDKAQPPISLGAKDGSLPSDLEPYRLDALERRDLAEVVGLWHQEDVWFARDGASW